LFSCSFAFVGVTLLLLFQVKNEAAVLGFVGAPFTLASYCVEGGSSKKLAFSEPAVLKYFGLHEFLFDNLLLRSQQLADSLLGC
jgi:uroporphyrinogen-III decarboxylase